MLQRCAARFTKRCSIVTQNPIRQACKYKLPKNSFEPLEQAETYYNRYSDISGIWSLQLVQSLLESVAITTRATTSDSIAMTSRQL